MSYDIDAIRSQFPALTIRDDGTTRFYFDNPAGTQVPHIVIHRMNDCMLNASANLGGNFPTSRLAGEFVREAREAVADLINAEAPEQVVFGQNMTTLTLHMSRSIARTLRDGDEIILSRMDHDANINPWLLMARDHGLTVRWLPFDTESFEIDLSEFDTLLNERTRLVCAGAASNLTGTINDVSEICRRARDAGALSFIDAVQSVPHVPTDVQAMGCDFLVCSAYKFFGPHQGMLYGRRDILESLEPYKARPASDDLPWRFETGTQSHEGMAGTGAAIDYFAWVGETMAGDYENRFAGRRRAVHAALACIADYELTLSQRLVDGLQSIPGIKVQGITAPDAMQRRVPTVAFTHDTETTASIAARLQEQNIFLWSGHNYALECVRELGIYESGGAVRVGPVHYNTIEEIDAVVAAIDGVVSTGAGNARAAGSP